MCIENWGTFFDGIITTNLGMAFFFFVVVLFVFCHFMESFEEGKYIFLSGNNPLSDLFQPNKIV